MGAASFRETVRAYRRAFEGAAPGRGARVLARLGLARVIRYVLSDAVWLGVVLADLEEFCHAGPRHTTATTAEDVNGRLQAELEGRRQVYLRIASFVTMTPAEEARVASTLAAEEREDQRNAA